MSFVLDALKLSEKRRSRFARPVYAHPPPVRRGGGRGRLFAALAVVPVLAGVFLTWRLAAPPSPAALPGTTGGARMSAAAEPAAAPVMVDGAKDSGTLDSATPVDTFSASTGDEQPLGQVPAHAATAEPEPAAAPADGLPLETAPPDWPALTLQMLFFSPERGRSFVQINGRNYRVGERLDEGPEVLEIAPHGVILVHQGKKVVLAMDR